ncbi:CpsB/CapC family capsule biosynthesis tyrosine phosphatase [Colwellia sp. E2M01]|uniref:tyrosine-protein phosphatase n=1 Tax=Colwellia sp. E2M01 TaxID=2841561 RepID=UPI001C08BCAA|nr:CpsB/CapC family capsule biosynthesis tyrosine phosphatase [Colwellia sp. E2M01]MBU2870043.1 capsule biosynthesis protein CapC [Colwellia sp. E2M01]
MIDIHCHLLPSIDDGAKDMAESLALIRLAVDEGISRIVLTPHLHFGRFNNTLPIIKSAFEVLIAEVKSANINVELAYAAEVRLDSEILTLLANKNLPLYGRYDGQHFMLLEFPHSHIPTGSEALVKYLKKQNITPVIAHPERNRDLLSKPHKIKEFVNLGCWFQVTAGSITGNFGDECQTLALQYIEQGLIQVVASDAHNLKRRPPLLNDARNKVVTLFGEDKAQALFHDNPYNITASLFKS